MEATESQHHTQGRDFLGGGDYVSEGLHVNLTLTNDGMSWTSSDKNSVFLEWRDVIRCHRGKVSARKPLDVREQTDKEPCFTVHYIEKQKDHVWKHKHKTFHSGDSSFDVILAIMCENCKKDHPGRLLVVINPVGGSGRGKSQYNHNVAPLFKLAQIETDVIVSKHPEHPEEIGNTYDFSTVDGVVVVGGDGTYQQLIRTWLPRIQREEGISTADLHKELKPLPCPIGIIPTGTGNGLARGQYGCYDVTTAALHIITGRTTWKHLAGVTSGGTRLGFVGVLLANGSLSDMLEGILEYRWLGILRGPIGGLSMFMRTRREFDIRLDYLPFVSHRDGHTADHRTSQLEWESIEGRYTGVMCLPGILRQNEASSTIQADYDAHGLTLFLEKQCGRIQYFSWLWKVQKRSNEMFDEDFVSIKRVREYKLKIVPTKPVEDEDPVKREERIKLEKTCRGDGEVFQLKNFEMEVRVHPKLHKAYGTGEI